MSKKITVLAMAVGVVAAMVLPTSASATWKHHETQIAQDVQLGLTGQVRFDTGVGGAECQFTSRIRFLVSQTTGAVETFAAHPVSETMNCKSFGGYAPCQPHNLTPQAPNWTFHRTTAETKEIIVDGPNPGEVTQKGTGVFHGALEITTQGLSAQSTGGVFCLGKTIVFTPGSVYAIPDQPKTFSSFQLNGSLLTHKQTNNGTVDKEFVKLTGTLQVEDPEQRNTYSI